MRTNYEMSESDLEALLDAMHPVFWWGIFCIHGRANAAWEKLGEEMGFDYMTVAPNGKGDRCFSAVPLLPKQVSRIHDLPKWIEQQQQLIQEKEFSLGEHKNNLKLLQEELAELESKPVEYRVWINSDGSFHPQRTLLGAYIGGYTGSREAVLIEKPKPVVVTDTLVDRVGEMWYHVNDQKQSVVEMLKACGIDAVKG